MRLFVCLYVIGMYKHAAGGLSANHSSPAEFQAVRHRPQALDLFEGR